MNTTGKIALFETTLSAIEEIAPQVFVLRFPRTEAFRPGQMLAVACKPDEQPRLYSIASGKDRDEYRILFNVQADGFLTPRLSKLKPGDTLFVSKPFGSFYGTDTPDWWIAAGTGIAPFISMMESGMSGNKTLVHGGRMQESFYFADAFAKELKQAYVRCSSVVESNDMYPGRLTKFLKEYKNLPVDANFYVCGSPQLVVDVRDILIARGVAYSQIIAEIYF